MKYLSVKQFAKQWNICERTVRKYCFLKKIPNVIYKDGKYLMPSNSLLPKRINENKSSNHLLNTLRLEKKNKVKGRIYHKIQIDLTYNSNHIEGNSLTHDQTRYIFETRTIGLSKDKTTKVDDIIETINHFSCIDKIIDNANYPLTESFIKKLHLMLKSGTNDSRLDWFNVGKYKKLPNEVGGNQTTKPENVQKEMNELLISYNKSKTHTLEQIIDFHHKFEKIHPFQDGNGRVGRLIMFKECLKNNIVPFIIYDEIKLFYYRGLKNWPKQKGYLLETCLSSQDKMKKHLDYFKIKYNH